MAGASSPSEHEYARRRPRFGCCTATTPSVRCPHAHVWSGVHLRRVAACRGRGLRRRAGTAETSMSDDDVERRTARAAPSVSGNGGGCMGEFTREVARPAD